MATGVTSWSRTAASNATADSNVNFQENQLPGTLNDSNRAQMASMAMYRDDIAGAIATGGTSTAYTVASYQGFASLAALSGQLIAFTPHTTNGATVTLSVDGLTAKPLRSAPSVELPSGVLVQGTPYVALYNNSDAAWYLQNYHVNPYVVPIGGMIDWWGASVPNSSFAFPTGQQISQATYSVLYALFGSNKFGTDGGGLFYMPNVAGRVTAMKESSASLLTSTYFVGDSTALGAVGGGESKTLLTANLPAYTPAGTVNWTGVYSDLNTGSGTAVPIFINGASGSGVGNTGVTKSFSGTPQGGTSTPLRTVQPTIICNKIMRII